MLFRSNTLAVCLSFCQAGGLVFLVLLSRVTTNFELSVLDRTTRQSKACHIYSCRAIACLYKLLWMDHSCVFGFRPRCNSATSSITDFGPGHIPGPGHCLPSYLVSYCHSSRIESAFSGRWYINRISYNQCGILPVLIIRE